MKIKVSNANTPNWKEVTVKSHIPEELKKLEKWLVTSGGHGITKQQTCLEI